MHDSVQTDAAIRAFFDQWHVYDLIIRNDYMAHRGIHAAIRASLLSRSAPFSVMDLGCGDGSFIAGTLRGLPIREYTGVDLSEVALGEAEKRFGDGPFRLRLIQSNFVDYLARPQTEKVDVVIAGFTVHHLQDVEKERFFSGCFARLADGGDLYLYDVFRKDGQRREEYLDLYCEPILSRWTALSKEQRESISEHIRAFDFPVTARMMSNMARKAGFDTPAGPEYEDPSGFHRLYRFRLSV